MEEFFNGGKTILYVSHDANSVKQLCTRAIFLDQGNILLDSDPNTVTKYYQKYIFSNDVQKREILQELTNLKDIPNQSNNVKTQQKNLLLDRSSDKKPNNSLKTLAELTSYFIPNFTPKNTIEYKFFNVDIHSPKILTETGKEVNVLIYGETYFYQVTFTSQEESTFENVAFGIDIHTDKGIIITSIESILGAKHGYCIHKLNPLEEITVTYEFTCLFSVGDYFINNGCSSFIDNQQQIINRKMDFFCFKVLDFDKRITGGKTYMFSSLKINDKTLWKHKEK